MLNLISTECPSMPRLAKGLESIRLIAMEVSEDMRPYVVPMLFSPLAAYVSNTSFQYPSGAWMEVCGQIRHLVGASGVGKAQLSAVVEAIMHRHRSHDEQELARLTTWQRTVKSMGSNKQKPERPSVALLFPPSDQTNAAFLQNCDALEKAGGRTQLIDVAEVEQLDKLCGSRKSVSTVMRAIFDRGRLGALRATVDGVTAFPILRANFCISSTPVACRAFYKTELFTGTLGRVSFSLKPRQERSGHIPQVGQLDTDFLTKLDVYLDRLESCAGKFVIPELNRTICRLSNQLADFANLSDDDTLHDLGKRSLVSAWRAGCILYVLNDFTWTRAMGEMVEWLVAIDLWSKLQLFGDMLKDGDTSIDEAGKNGPKNMLDKLPNTFNEAQLAALRSSVGKSPDGAKRQLIVWKCRGFVEYSTETGLFSKTSSYLNRKR